MLSILIPTYNYDALQLVHDMSALAAQEHVEHEIIIGNDCSTTNTNWMNTCAAWPGVRIVQPAGNIGRAAICNLMAREADGDWLLIVDSDAQVSSGFSLTAYLQAAQQAPVVCGGLYHPAHNPNPASTLRFKYEHAADRKRSAQTRMKNPYRSFCTFNILVKKSLFDTIGGFDRDCKEYGYEDTLFGAELAKHGVKVLHIDNPLLHKGLDTNAEFLRKTETSLHTLKGLKGKMNGWSGIENMATKIDRLRLRPVVTGIYRLSRPLLRKNLLSRHPSLFVFQFYKLGYFMSLEETANQ